MRIVSYNIFKGAEGRADPVGEVIEAQRPDLVALIEADDPGVLQRIARRLGFDLIHAPGERHAVALLSRWPIVQTINHAPLDPTRTACLLQAVVQPTDQPALTVGVVHLDPQGAHESDRQVRKVLDVFAPLRQDATPHLLAIGCEPAAPSIDPLIHAGYHDALQQAHGQPVSDMGTFSTQAPSQRADFLLAFALPTRSAWIEQDRLAKYASDHFPIGAEFTPSSG